MNPKLIVPAIVLGVTIVPLSGIAQSTTTNLEVTAEVASDLSALPDDTPLFLAVVINGREIGLVAEFLAHPTENRISSTRGELAEIGLKAPPGVKNRVYLDSFRGLAYEYDETAQVIRITAPTSAMLPRVISAANQPDYVEPEKSYGAVLNYALAGDFSTPAVGSGLNLNSVSIGLDGWVFTPLGTLSSTGAVRYANTPGADADFIRYETKYEVSNATKALTFSAGDFTSSGLQWSRPIRMAGVQLRRDFSLRSDLVTDQLMTYSGAALVPSTVDVFIENNRTFSSSVTPGPFQIEDLPFYSGSGDAIIVVTDKNGNVKKRRVTFFAAENLIKKGVADYSFEAGYARQAFGVESDNYSDDLAFSASFRYGLSEQITLQSHVEGKSDLTMAGIGVNFVPFSLAEISLTTGASDYNGVQAGFVSGTLRTNIGDVDLSASAMRAQPGFADLAYATGLDYLGAAAITGGGSLLEFPTALDVISVAIPVTKDSRKLGLSMVHSKRASSEDLVAGVSFGNTIGNGRGSYSMNGSHNLITDESRIGLNLSISLGNRTYVRSAISRDNNGQNSTSVNLTQSMGDQVGDFGYGIQIESQNSNIVSAAHGEYRTRYGEGRLDYQRGASANYLRGQFDGAVVTTGGRVAAGNTINDSFALVDVGVPNTAVYLQNRKSAITNRAGRALVSGLSSNRRNRVSVEVAEMPAEAIVAATAMDVVPARKSGSLVNFKGSNEPSVLVVLRKPNGAVLPVGAVAKLSGSKDDIYVGYDGLAWIEGVKGKNRLKVKYDGQTCTAEFSFVANDELQDLIDPVVCQ